MNVRDVFVAPFARIAARPSTTDPAPTLSSADSFEGIGAPSSRRLPLFLALVAALVCALAFAASGALAAAPPVVSGVQVSEVGVTTAKISGNVNPEGASGEPANTNWLIEVSPVGAATWAQVGSGTIEPPAAEEANDVPVEAVAGFVGELEPGAEYEVRIVAENPTGTDEEVSAAFTMEAASAPLLTTQPATEIGYSTAVLHGEVDAQGGNVNPIGGTLPIHWTLEYREAGAFAEPGEGWSPANPVGGDNELTETEAEGTTAVEAEVPGGGLATTKSYETRLTATYLNFRRQAASDPPFESFETLIAVAPALAPLPATGITRRNAHIAGTVDPEGGNINPLHSEPVPIEWRLQYTLASEPTAWQTAGSGTISGSEATGTSPIEVGADLNNLQSGHEYLYRVLATVAGQSTTSTPANLTTNAGNAPSLTTEAADHVGTQVAYLNGTVNANEEDTNWWFEWGPQNCELSPCTAVPASKDREAKIFNLFAGTESFTTAQLIVGLQPSTTYHFRLAAENGSGLAHGADLTFTTRGLPAAQSCANEVRREEEHAGYLPDCRAYEMVSPVDKDGADVMVETTRTRAAAGESPGLPAAISFASLGGFADVRGGGIATEYMAERTGAAGTQGWGTHAISPPSHALSYLESISGLEPGYLGSFSPDLTQGVLRSIEPLTAEPKVAGVPNLYLRNDLRTPGAGAYELLTDSAAQMNPAQPDEDVRSFLAATSADFRHVLFESKMNRTADARTINVKLYKTDDSGLPRLVVAGPGCPGAPGVRAAAPCSSAGRGASGFHYTDEALSEDGSRTDFFSPVRPNSRPVETSGAASKLFQLDDQGTIDRADDAIIQLDTSELASPEPTRFAFFTAASKDGSRVFFRDPERLTSSAPTGEGGLYLWRRARHNQTQELVVNASGGTFTLTAHTQPSSGSGELSKGSTAIGNVEGSFSVGQTIRAPGLPAGTIIVSAPSATELTVSEPATQSGTQSLSATVQATTPPLPSDASAEEVQRALQSLATAPADPEQPIRLIGEGNAEVSGGAGSPYSITFDGALEGVSVLPLTADSSNLSGGAATTSVSVTVPVTNLFYVAPGEGAIGASADGRRLYFVARGRQLVPGTPPLSQPGLYLWSEVGEGGTGTISFVSSLAGGNEESSNTKEDLWSTLPSSSRVTPSGEVMEFFANSGLATPNVPAGSCPFNATGGGVGCSQMYLYRVAGSTPTHPNLICASCSPVKAVPQNSTYTDARILASGTMSGTYLNRVLSADGRLVFFTTAESLVPEDTNGKKDAYEYDSTTDEVHLLSSGTESSDSFFLDASEDGKDAYIITRARLVGWDHDSSYDIYDVRIGGGFPEPPSDQTAPCSGESCRAPAAVDPPIKGTTSSSSSGKNLRPKKVCRKGRHVHRGQKKKACKSRRHLHRKHRHPHRKHQSGRGKATR